MRTLHLRDVPDAVVSRLERMAAINGLSLNAVAVRELESSSRRADNAALLASLPDLPVEVAQVLADRNVRRDHI